MVFIPSALILSALSLVSAVPYSSPVELRARQSNTTIPYPADDPFYTPPGNLASYKPGAIIRSRKVATTLQGNSTQILYRSTSQNGSAISSVTTVIVPTNGKASNDKLVAFLTAEDSVASKCAPSYTYRAGSSPESAIVLFEQVFASLYLDQGYTVTVPDYEGPNSAFAVGRLSGRLSLDGVRAALNLKELNWASNVKVAATGYSGGAIAGGWFAALKNNYAPEINLVGVSIGGTPANVSQVLEYVDGTIWSGFGLSGVVGLVNAYAAFGPLYNRLATAAGNAAFVTGRSQCVIGNVLAFAFKRFIGPEYQTLGDRILYEPTVARIVAENVLGTVKSETPVGFPIQIFHGTQDQIIPINGTDYAVNQWCKNGANQLNYIRVSGAEHIGLEFAGAPQALNFINDRFAGKPFINGCQTVTGQLPYNTSSLTIAQQARLNKAYLDLQLQLGPKFVLPKLGN